MRPTARPVPPFHGAGGVAGETTGAAGRPADRPAFRVGADTGRGDGTGVAAACVGGQDVGVAAGVAQTQAPTGVALRVQAKVPGTGRVARRDTVVPRANGLVTGADGPGEDEGAVAVGPPAAALEKRRRPSVGVALVPVVAPTPGVARPGVRPVVAAKVPVSDVPGRPRRLTRPVPDRPESPYSCLAFFC